MKKIKINQKKLITYLDDASTLDHNLFAISDLCSGASEKMSDPVSAINWIGEVIRKHIERHRELRNIYFKEPNFK